MKAKNIISSIKNVHREKTKHSNLRTRVTPKNRHKDNKKSRKKWKNDIEIY